MTLDLVLCTGHYLIIVKLGKLTLGGRFITNPLVAESSLSKCEDAQYANVPKDDRFGYPRMFLRDGDFERALVLHLI
jgi:hypothetical protein